MRWCVKPRKELVNIYDWHDWFAWYPVCINDTWFWWEAVECKGVEKIFDEEHGGIVITWYYREINKGK